MRNFDALIIGSGQAGNPLAFKLADEGLKVALIEKEHLGGTCVNDGCTPTKTYVASARRIWAVRNAAVMGVSLDAEPSIDLKEVRARKDRIVNDSVEGLRQSLEDHQNIELIRAEAQFTGPKQVKAGDQQLTAPEIYINVGGRPRIPEGFADCRYLTNTSILELGDLPDHLIIVGASYIGLEFGQMFRRFGSRVTIIDRNARPVHHEDEDISEAIKEFMEEEGVKFRLKSECISAENMDHDQIRVHLECEDSEKEVTGSHLLLAAGRQPNSDGLNLEATGLATDKRGYIPVNEQLETEIAGIFAMGDCNGRGAFTHTSYNDYEILIDQKFGEGQRKVSDRIPTYALYTDPPLGRAGMTLEEAKAAGYEVLVGEISMKQVARAKEKGETHGKMKVLINAKDQRILGASILGTGGDEVVTGLLNVMYADKPYTLLRDSVVAHPTVSELIPSLLENLEPG